MRQPSLAAFLANVILGLVTATLLAAIGAPLWGGVGAGIVVALCSR